MRLDPCDSHYSTEFDQIRQALNGFARSRIFHDPELGLWLIAGHDNVRIALTNTQLFFTAATLGPVRPLTDAAAVWAGIDVPAPFGGVDKAQHTRIRALLRESFPSTARRASEKWAAAVTARAEQQITDLTGHNPPDLVCALATRLPLLVALDILGLPSDIPDSLTTWASGFVKPGAGGLSSVATPDTAHALRDFWAWCRTLVTIRAERPEPGSGLIGELLRHRDGDNTRLSLDTIAALALYLTVAGWQVTSRVLRHALEHALADPNRWARLADDDHYLNNHVEESLRHTSTIIGLLRITSTDVTLDQTVIPAGSRCLVLVGSANHDPRVYTSPGRFDPGRAWLSQHLTFGARPHRCLGASLVRLQLCTALRTLARRLPHLRFTESHRPRFPPYATPLIHAGLHTVAGIPTGCPFGNDPDTGEQP
jgi:cytochrome P450